MAGPEIKQNPEKLSLNEVQKQDIDFVNKLEDKSGDQIISTYITEKGGNENGANILKSEARTTIFNSIQTYKIENQASCSTETLQTIAITQDMLKGLQKEPTKPLTPEEIAKKETDEKAKNNLDMNGYLDLVSDKTDVKNASKNIIEGLRNNIIREFTNNKSTRIMEITNDIKTNLSGIEKAFVNEEKIATNLYSMLETSINKEFFKSPALDNLLMASDANIKELIYKDMQTKNLLETKGDAQYNINKTNYIMSVMRDPRLVPGVTESKKSTLGIMTNILKNIKTDVTNKFKQMAEDAKNAAPTFDAEGNEIPSTTPSMMDIKNKINNKDPQLQSELSAIVKGHIDGNIGTTTFETVQKVNKTSSGTEYKTIDEWKKNMKDINKKMQEDVPLTPEQQKEFKKVALNNKIEETVGGKLTFGKKGEIMVNGKEMKLGELLSMIIGKFLGISFDTGTEDSDTRAKNNVDAAKIEYKKIKKEDLKSMPTETYTKEFGQHTFNNDAGVKALLPTFKNIPTESLFATMEKNKVPTGSMMNEFKKNNTVDANVVRDINNKVTGLSEAGKVAYRNYLLQTTLDKIADKAKEKNQSPSQEDIENNIIYFAQTGKILDFAPITPKVEIPPAKPVDPTKPEIKPDPNKKVITPAKGKVDAKPKTTVKADKTNGTKK